VISQRREGREARKIERKVPTYLELSSLALNVRNGTRDRADLHSPGLPDL